MTQMTGLANKDIKTALDNIFHTFKTLRKKQNILSKDIKYVRNIQTEILEMTATAFRRKINQMATRQIRHNRRICGLDSAIKIQVKRNKERKD